MTVRRFAAPAAAPLLSLVFAASAVRAAGGAPAAAKDWATTGAFRDEVSFAPDGRFAAGFRGEDLFRVEWDAMNGFTDAIVLRLGEGEGGAPALRAERLRTTPRTHFAMDSATIALARAEGGPALRTARFPAGPDASGVGGRGERDPFVALAWVPDPEAPFPVYGIFPDAATPGDREALARGFLEDPAAVLASRNPRLRPFVLWIGAAEPPRPAAVSAALARLGRAASGRRTGALSFEGPRPRPDGRAALLLSTNAPLNETLRVRLQLRAVASSAVPAAEQGLRLVGEAVLDRRPAPNAPWVTVEGSSVSVDRTARWRARPGGGFELAGDFGPRLSPGDPAPLPRHRASRGVGEKGSRAQMDVVLTLDAPAARELSDPDVSELGFTIAARVGLNAVSEAFGDRIVESALRLPPDAGCAVSAPLRLRIADEPAPAPGGVPTEAELRALSARVRALDRSDAFRALRACSNAIARAAAVFDPGWDPDLEREARLLAEQERRFVRGAAPSEALVPWAEVRAWEPEDRVQAAAADLRAAVVDVLAEAGGRDRALAALLEKGDQTSDAEWSQLLAEDVLLLDALKAPSALARAMRLDAMLRRLRQVGPGDLTVLGLLRSRFIRLSAAAGGARERAALHARAIREMLAVPIDWSAYTTDEYNMARTNEHGRRQWLQACFDDRDHPDYRPAVVSCYRMAEHFATLAAAEERVADIRFETHVMRFDRTAPTNPPPGGARIAIGGPDAAAEGLSESLKGPAGWVMSPRYAEEFASARSILAIDIWHATSYAMPALPPALCAPFADEIGRVSGERSGSLASWLEDLHWRRPDARPSPAAETSPGWAPRPFDPGRLLPSPQAGDPGLARELARYGLRAGVFEQESQELHPAGTNSFPWLLFAPTNAAPDARLPLVFFAPGSGELGRDLRKQFRQRGIFEKVCSPDFQARHPCFLLVIPPENLREQTVLYGSLPGGRPTPAQCTMIDALLAVARSQKGPFVDEDRIVGAGLISGSTELVGLARNFPGFFAALALTGSEGLWSPEQDVPAAAPSRWWIFGTEGEWGLPEPGERETLRARLESVVRDRGGELRFTVFEPSGRPVWDRAWETDGLWDWLFSHRRPARRPRSILRSPATPSSWSFSRIRPVPAP